MHQALAGDLRVGGWHPDAVSALSVPLPLLARAAGRGVRAGLTVARVAVWPASRLLQLLTPAPADVPQAELPAEPARTVAGGRLGAAPQVPPKVSAADARPARVRSVTPVRRWSLPDSVQLLHQGYDMRAVVTRTGWTERELRAALRRS